MGASGQGGGWSFLGSPPKFPSPFVGPPWTWHRACGLGSFSSFQPHSPIGGCEHQVGDLSPFYRQETEAQRGQISWGCSVGPSCPHWQHGCGSSFLLWRVLRGSLVLSTGHWWLTGREQGFPLRWQESHRRRQRAAPPCLGLCLTLQAHSFLWLLLLSLSPSPGPVCPCLSKLPKNEEHSNGSGLRVQASEPGCCRSLASFLEPIVVQAPDAPCRCLGTGSCGTRCGDLHFRPG